MWPGGRWPQQTLCMSPTQHTGPQFSPWQLHTCTCRFLVQEGLQHMAPMFWYRCHQWRCGWKQHTSPTPCKHMHKVRVVSETVSQILDKIYRKMMTCHRVGIAAPKCQQNWLWQPAFLCRSYTSFSLLVPMWYTASNFSGKVEWSAPKIRLTYQRRYRTLKKMEGVSSPRQNGRHFADKIFKCKFYTGDKPLSELVMDEYPENNTTRNQYDPT